MKKILRKVVPTRVLDARTKRRYSKDASRFKDWDIDEVFTDIYQKNSWGIEETLSGQGSTIEQMRPILHEIEEVFQSLEINSLLDLPCGDFNWMEHVNLSGIQYIGGEIVPELVNNNQAKYGSELVEFRLIDITSDELPKVDMILNKDCFIQLIKIYLFYLTLMCS